MFAITEKNSGTKQIFKETKDDVEDSCSETASQESEIFAVDELIEFSDGSVGPIHGPRFKLSEETAVSIASVKCPFVYKVVESSTPRGVLSLGASIATEYVVTKQQEMDLKLLLNISECSELLISHVLGKEFLKLVKVKRLSHTVLSKSLEFKVDVENPEVLRTFKKLKTRTKLTRVLKKKDQFGFESVNVYFYEFDCFADGRLVLEGRNCTAGFLTCTELAEKKTLKPKFTKPKRTQTEKEGEKLLKLLMLKDNNKNMQVGDERSSSLGYLIGSLVPIPTAGEESLFKSSLEMVHEFANNLNVSELFEHQVKLGFVKKQPLRVSFRNALRVNPTGTVLSVLELRKIVDSSNEQNREVVLVADITYLLVENTTFSATSLEELENFPIAFQIANIHVRFSGEKKFIKSPVKKVEVLKSEKAEKTVSFSNAIPIPANCLSSSENAVSEVTWHPLYKLLKASNLPLPSFKPTNLYPRQICAVPFLKSNQTLSDLDNTIQKIGPNQSFDPAHFLNDIDGNFEPGVLPLNFYNLCEFQLGKISKCVGQKFEILDDSRTSRSPAFELAFITRVIKANEIRNLKNSSKVDPSKGEMISEFDVPRDAWFFNMFKGNKGHIPYFLVMEIALQTTGVLSNYLEASLAHGVKDVVFRNLDAKAEMFANFSKIDFRGKTIINRTRTLSYNKMGGMLIHRFSFELFVKEPNSERGNNGKLSEYISTYEKENIDNNIYGCLYKGETTMGWFLPEIMSGDAGLDNGVKKPLTYQTDTKLKSELKLFPGLKTVRGKENFIRGKQELQREIEIRNSLVRKNELAEFLDGVGLAEKYGYGWKMINKDDWLFSCHFWNDPVLPGSVGIESMFELAELYMIHNKIYTNLEGFSNENSTFGFRHCRSEVSWKYRGQVNREHKKLEVEIIVKSLTLQKEFAEIEVEGNVYIDGTRIDVATGIKLQLYCYCEQNRSNLTTELTIQSLKAKLADLQQHFLVTVRDSKLVEVDLTQAIPFDNSLSIVHAMSLTDLGDSTFSKFYGVEANFYSGAMAKGISSDYLVIAMGLKGLLSCFGAGGLSLSTVETSIMKIKSYLGNRPFAVNLIHSPFDPSLEERLVDLFDKQGVTIVEASAFMNLTTSVILYRARGLELDSENGEIIIKNKLIAKCSRTEVAAMFLHPAPLAMLKSLLEQRKITEVQFQLAQFVPVADDITIEADSGGHTDNRPLGVILPLVIKLRDEIYSKLFSEFQSKGVQYRAAALAYNKESLQNENISVRWPIRTRIGVGGGIGCGESVLGAISTGASYIVTGSINQLCSESGTSDVVRELLSEASYSDITMAPSADMFDQGVKVQVLKKGTMFAARASKLYELFIKYNSLEEIPEIETNNLEKKIFKMSLDNVWLEVKKYYENKVGDSQKVFKVEYGGDQKLKMSMVFRWYLNRSSYWATQGSVERKADYQIWCGPAIGAFNNFIKGTALDPKIAKKYPSVVDANLAILHHAIYLHRLSQLNCSRQIKQILKFKE